MGQIQTNCNIFWQDLNSDDGFQRIKIKQKSLANSNNSVSYLPLSSRIEWTPSRIEEVSIKNICTDDAIWEDVINENSSLDLSISSENHKSSQQNRVKIISQGNKKGKVFNKKLDEFQGNQTIVIKEPKNFNNCTIVTPNMFLIGRQSQKVR